ncbi:hypothetical protein Y032_0053g2387 [Ancylostoma ceylanicum]|uniref:Uncharacterized protein n=1 Tax=Ancylostoma ceylanicum TaxID=53326 RepID=A0A016U6Z4_9BILA|nr:hypothetical protein Y032_0053g2387 [Ancylostoma ceylanicum]
MVKQSDIQVAILATSLLMATLTSYAYDQWQKRKAPPDIPLQAWDKYVELQKKSVLLEKLGGSRDCRITAGPVRAVLKEHALNEMIE